QLSVQQLFDERRERLGLAWAAGRSGAGREFTGDMLHKPGVGLIGHLNLIHPLLAQVMGRREVDYIEKLAPEERGRTANAIGKSELALELISRGHGLVADDVVELQQIGPETIQGRCPTMLRDFLEVRGLGVLNIRSIFGETAIRPRKALRLIVHLELADLA